MDTTRIGTAGIFQVSIVIPDPVDRNPAVIASGLLFGGREHEFVPHRHRIGKVRSFAYVSPNRASKPADHRVTGKSKTNFLPIHPVQTDMVPVGPVECELNDGLWRPVRLPQSSENPCQGSRQTIDWLAIDRTGLTGPRGRAGDCGQITQRLDYRRDRGVVHIDPPTIEQNRSSDTLLASCLLQEPADQAVGRIGNGSTVCITDA